jgi:hypothetical protein
MGRHLFTEIEKECILQWLALGFTPQQIVDFVKDDFGKSCSRQNIHEYQKNHAERIGKLREEIKGNLEAIPFTRKEVRIANLDRVARKLLIRRNYRDFATILKQIAEETGQLVQKHEHTGKDGGPIDTTVRITVGDDPIDDDTPGDQPE